MRKQYWMKDFLFFGFLALMVLSHTTRAEVAQPRIQVVATLPDLGSLAKAVGGDAVEVVSLGKGWEDAHFVLAKPSFIHLLNRADLYVETGLDLEMGWAPALLREARNPRIQPGAKGHLVAAQFIEPLDIPATAIDRSHGDVHPGGNPHFLTDPICGLQVAGGMAKRFAEMWPEKRESFDRNYGAFRERLSMALVGERLSRKYDVEKLSQLYALGKLKDFLSGQGELQDLGGWLGEMWPFFGTLYVDDHNLWPYFARRFGLVAFGHLEPKPGIKPTTKHLESLVARMKATQVPILLASPYYDRRFGRFVQERTGVRIVELANQVDGRPGTEDYLRMLDYNIKTLRLALGGKAT